MTNIATNNGSVVIKNGSVGTDCGCCGGWYCEGGDSGCNSCDSTPPSVLHAQFTLTVHDGSKTFAVPLKRTGGTLSRDGGVCDEYVVYWGSIGNIYDYLLQHPEVVFLSEEFEDSGIYPVISFTYNGQQVSYPFSGAIFVRFNGRCGPFEQATVENEYRLPNAVSIVFHWGYGMQWFAAPSGRVVSPTPTSKIYLGDPYRHSGGGTCYADWPGVDIPSIGGSYSTLTPNGSISLSITSVE